MSGGSIGGTLGTALGVALAPETGGLSLAIPGLAGAAGGALGSYVTGDSKNMWKNALMGGIGGAAGGGLNNLTENASGLGNLFGTGGDIQGALPSWAGGISSAANAAGAGTAGASLAPSFASASAPATMSTFGNAALDTSGIDSLASNLGVGASDAASTVAPTIGSKLMGYAPYAGLGLGAMALDHFTAPKQVGPPMQSDPKNPGPVKPLMRTSQNVDPNSYFSPSTAENRSYYSPYSMQPQFMARGGLVKKFASGGSSSASSSNIPKSSYGGKLVNTAIQHPAMYPIKGKNNGTLRYYADGGSADGMVNGMGDGQSDSIPAQLSDGEFVVSAPVVSALGNGSNKAGAKKLDMVQKNVLRKHYKGGKPHKAMGLASYVH